MDDFLDTYYPRKLNLLRSLPAALLASITESVGTLWTDRGKTFVIAEAV